MRARIKGVSAQDWNLLTGIMTGAQTLLLIPLAATLQHTSHSANQWATLIAVCIGLAVFSSILGNTLWNRASKLLPLTMVGQMILFETLFALLYGFLWEQRLPTGLETTAFVFVALSVILCITAHKREG